ncbi:MAG: amidohydrolase family protein [Verrucomicrobia bacterium]|nr:amidohydrolase family protein [Verrucomicrobiota bacterium]MBU1735536.1 amidohydrolase family protein [Verrucomicrobiota bacterium]MBU1858003.1 amidohydrolase family protein [Verrucomicrobiota bacterium]
MNKPSNRLFDVHAHLGDYWDDVELGDRGQVAALRAAQKTGRIAISIVSACESLLSATRLPGDTEKTMRQRLLAGNEKLLRMCIQEPSLYMLAVLDPQRPDSFEQCRKLLNHPRVLGVKLHPTRHYYRIADHIQGICDFLKAAPKRVLLMHGINDGWSDPEPVIHIASQYPEISFILAHLGRTNPSMLTVDLIRQYHAPNVYVDTSAMRDSGVLQKAVSIMGSDKILFGTDFPFYLPKDILPLILNSGIRPDQQTQILAANAQQLFNLK